MGSCHRAGEFIATSRTTPNLTTSRTGRRPGPFNKTPSEPLFSGELESPSSSSSCVTEPRAAPIRRDDEGGVGGGRGNENKLQGAEGWLYTRFLFSLIP